VHAIHEARIVHSDLKPANFLVVEGRLKLIDFGIAKAISSDTTSIARESQARRGPMRSRALPMPACNDHPASTQAACSATRPHRALTREAHSPGGRAATAPRCARCSMSGTAAAHAASWQGACIPV